MSTDERKEMHNQSRFSATAKRRSIGLLGFALLMPLTACGQGGRNMQKETVLALTMYSYLDRPIFDIVFDGTDIGVANSYGGTGVITAVRIPFGTQTLTWRLDGPKGKPGNGEHRKIKNNLTISPTQIPPGTRYIGVHLYPDDTAEVTFAELIPERSMRGSELIDKAGGKFFNKSAADISASNNRL